MHHIIHSAEADQVFSQHTSTYHGDRFHNSPEDHNKYQATAEAHRKATAQKTVDKYFGHPEVVYNSEESRKTGVNKLVKTAEDLLGTDLTISPSGSRCGPTEKRFGCAASISNILLKDHQISSHEFCNSVDDLERLLVRQKGAVRVGMAQLRKGDIVIGRDQLDGSSGRHVGIVDVGLGGQLMVLNNHAGCFSRDPLKQRFFDQYGQVYGLRLKCAP
jgi:hypothetical protein